MAETEFDILAGIFGGILLEFETKILSFITPPIDDADETLAELIERLRQRIVDAIETGDKELARRIQQLVAPMELRLIEADKIARDLQAKIIELNRQVVSASAETTQLLSAKIDASIESQTALFDTALTGVESTIIESIDASVEQSDKAFTFFGIKIGESLDKTLDFIQDTTDPILRSVTDIIPGFAGLLEGFILPLLAPIAGVFANPDGFFKTLLETVITGPLTDTMGKGAGQIDEFIKELEADEDFGPFVKQYTGGGVISIGLVGIAFLVLSAQSIASSTIGAFLTGALQNATKKSLRRFHPTVLSVAEFQESTRRASPFLSEAFDDMRDQGFTEERIGQLSELSTTLLPAGEIIQLWLREEIDESEAKRRLSELGYTLDDVTHLQTLGFAIPGIADIIQMAVREVFTPEIAERFGQFEDIPPDYIVWAKRQGLDEFWARNFWAAHWQLPSIGQVFEMFHRTIDESPDENADTITLPSGATTRNVVGADTLQTLLRAQDVMPFWRDKLTEIAFRPLTRVDVRRMHARGVLSDDAVFRSYLDLGYNKANAQRMLEFTIAFNQSPADEDVLDARELTRTQIVNFVEDGLMNEPDALAALQDIGYSVEHAITIVEAKLLDIARDLRKLQVATVRERFINSMIDFNQATDQLSQLGLSDAQTQKILADMEGVRKSRIRIPTRADMDNFVEAGIVTDDEYLLILEAIGYVEPWPRRYLELAKG